MLVVFYVFDCWNFFMVFCLFFLVFFILISLLKLISKIDYWGVLFLFLYCYYIKSKKKFLIVRIIFFILEKICGYKYLCIKLNYFICIRGNFYFCKIFNFSYLLKVFVGNRYYIIDLLCLVFNICINNWEIKLRFWDYF